MPTTPDRQRRQERRAPLDDQWHPARDIILITQETEMAREGRGGGEQVEITLQRIGPQPWHPLRVASILQDRGVCGRAETPALVVEGLRGRRVSELGRA